MNEILIENRIKRFRLTCELKDGDKVRHFYNGYEYVEIGGIKWAVMNVGAEKVTDSGLYFQWGDTRGYTKEAVENGEKIFNFGTCRYYDGNKFIKYNTHDKKTVLEFIDDAACVNMGGSWRMPTKDEYVALGAAVNTAWTTDYQGSGVAGLVLTSKADSSKKLFFPAAGFCFNGSVRSAGFYGFYWSSSFYSSNVQYCFDLGFYSGYVGWQNDNKRYNGFSVRGVVGENR